MMFFGDFRMVLTIGVILSNVFSPTVGSSRSSETIKFENGRYNDITIAIDGDKVGSAECLNIRSILEEILPEFSNSLFEATGRRASLGRVNVLFPRNWSATTCELGTALPNLSYNSAHLQITQGHPLASSLPWTRQYKPCGQEGDSIVVPLPFLLSNSNGFSKAIKGRLLLHEWTKFRYGAFDEIGYIDEEEMNGVFDPCYMSEKQAQFTSCTGKRLPSVAQTKSACSLEFLGRQVESLTRQLMQTNTSVMSSPYLDNVAHYCDSSNHNYWAATKQNMFCRRSVSEVVNSHADFRNVNEQGENPMQNPSPPEIRFLRQTNYPTAYAFVIDNSREMRDEYKILHVKQAITEFVKMLELNTEVHLTIFADSTVTETIQSVLRVEGDKINILQHIPDLTDDNSDRSVVINRRLLPVIDSVIDKLSTSSGTPWNVMIFSDSTVNVEDMSPAIAAFEGTPHSLSIFTFESESVMTSGDWLDWYRIPNTRNVMVLPYCRSDSVTEPGPCNLQTSIFIVDHLVGLLNEQEDNPRFIQNVAQVDITNGANQVQNFNLNLGDASNIKHVYLFFPLPQSLSNPSSVIKLTPPTSTGECVIGPLLDYTGVMAFEGTGCTQSGQWSLRLESRIPVSIARLHLDVFVEHEQTGTNRLQITTSLGQTDLTQGIQPNVNLTSIFVHVTDSQGHPVLDADVHSSVFYPHLMSPGQTDLPTEIALKDDGNSNNGADQTANDGIYSNYLYGYSKTTPSFHLIRVTVSTSENTKVLQEIEPPNAAFLQREMQAKCCGQVIRPRRTRDLGSSLTFQTLHLGFKTVTPWTKTVFAPGSIRDISVTDDNDTFITIQFESVSGDLGNSGAQIQSIYACCIPTSNADDAPPPPDETRCRPDTTQCGTFQPPGTTQTCEISKQKLVDEFIPTTEERRPNLLVCGLRVFNTNSEPGQLSSSTFDVPLSNEILTRNDEPKCDSIHDDCLPMLIFWIMIGCIALLLLLLVIVLILWFCLSRKRKNKPQPTPARTSVYVPPTKKENKSAYPPAGDEDSVEYTTVVVERPNRERKAEEPNVVKELFVNHAYIQNEDGDLKIIADNGRILRKPLNNTEPSDPIVNRNHSPVRRTPEPSAVDTNMQIYKPEPQPKRIVPGPGPIPQTRDRSIKPPYQDRPRIIHQNPMLRSDSEFPQNEITIPSTTNSTAAANPYATISRIGRSRPLSGVDASEKITSPNQAGIDPHYMTPQHATMPVRNDKPPRRDPIPSTFRARSPPPVHPYPSSDTDSTIYADTRKPPRFTKPPAYPAGSKLVSGNPNHHPSNPPVSTFSGGRPTKSISSAGSPPAYPPVPPPRYNDRSRDLGGPTSKVNPPSSNRYLNRHDDDDDSDEWDDGDGYNQGTSYA